MISYKTNEIILKLRGGLGNQLFQTAAGLYICNKHNKELIINTEFLESNINQGIPDIIKYGFLKNINISNKKLLLDKLMTTAPNSRHNSKWYEKKLQALYIRLGKIFTDPQNLDQSYFQQKKLFIPKIVQGWFQTEFFIKELNKSGFYFDCNQFKLENYNHLEVREILGDKVLKSRVSISELGNYIAIHRRNYPRGLIDLGNLTPDYFLNALDYFLNRKRLRKLNIKREKINIFVVSDNFHSGLELAKFLSKQTGFRILILSESNSESSDIAFKILYNAHQLVISNSTFSWWAAYLGKSSYINNNKKRNFRLNEPSVVCPSNWFKYASYSNSLIPGNWKQIKSYWV